MDTKDQEDSGDGARTVPAEWADSAATGAFLDVLARLIARHHLSKQLPDRTGGKIEQGGDCHR